LFHYHPIQQHLRKITGKDVDRMAVMELIIHLEQYVDQIAAQCIKEHENLNSMRKTQGLYQKARIDRLCILNAIKHLTKVVPPKE
jgi:hypothetical protein